MILNPYTIFWTPILEYLQILLLPNSKLSPISLSVTARKNLNQIQILGEMYKRNCNLSPMMLALSSVAVQTDINLNCFFFYSNSHKPK